jgi:DNA repair exonuclease SbcCD nuclease subunit
VVDQQGRGAIVPARPERRHHRFARRVRTGGVTLLHDLDRARRADGQQRAHRVALHGRSFPHRLTGDFVQTYPARRDGWLNIGVLHTSLDGTRGHDGYAPCSVDDLKRFGYDYWALGHIHATEIVSRDPWIVFPGNLQGRSVRETGAKGVMRVTVEDGRIVEVTPLVLDGARWTHLEIDVGGIDDEADIIARIDAALIAAHSEAETRPLAARVTLRGATPLHNRLIARREPLQDDLRAGGFRIAEDCWIEQLKIKTSPPQRAATISPDAETLDIDAMLREAAADPDFAAIMERLIKEIEDKLPKDLRDELRNADTLTALGDDARALLAGALS